MTAALPTLGFAIPTYRRPDLLDRALASVVPQAVRLGAPVYIADDACDDTNVAVVARWRAVHEGVLHDINEQNLGIDRNIDRAICRCPARFVHIMGEDDVIYPGFAERILAAIAAVNGGEPAHVVCSYQYLANDYAPITGRPVIPADLAPGTLRDLLPRYGWALGFIGTHVFNRARFATDGLDGFGSYFHHLMRLVTGVGADEPIGYVGDALVGNRADDETTATWSGDRLAVVFGLERTLARAMRQAGGYSQAEIAAMVAAARRHLGYAETVRLLYWGALAERDGRGEAYWASLAEQVSAPRARLLRMVSRPVKAVLLKAIPGVRQAKRRLQRAL